ncbi:MAG: hypothetical protein ACOC56_02935 [Atribacterota bacterium]
MKKQNGEINMSKRVVKSFSELEQDWNNSRRGPHRVCVQSGFIDDSMLFWFWFKKR